MKQRNISKLNVFCCTKFECCRNQNVLHVAVTNGNIAIVEQLLESLDDADKVNLINATADGAYFKRRHINGQLCITAAAWTMSGDMIKLLVKHGADLSAKNLQGNTLLHVLVQLYDNKAGQEHKYAELLQQIWQATGIWALNLKHECDGRNQEQEKLEHQQKQNDLFKELLSLRNHDGYTPLALAAMHGSKLFLHFLELEKIYKFPQNKLGSISWVTYDVCDITSFAHGYYNKFSILHLLAHNNQQLSRKATVDGSDEHVVDLLNYEPIKSLLDCKWAFYRWHYITWLLVHFVYMIAFTSSTYKMNSSTYDTNVKFDLLQHVFQPVEYNYGFFLLLPGIYLLLEFLDVFGNAPYRVQFLSGPNILLRVIKCLTSEITITGNGPYRLLMTAFSVYTIAWFILYLNHSIYQVLLFIIPDKYIKNRRLLWRYLSYLDGFLFSSLPEDVELLADLQ